MFLTQLGNPCLWASPCDVAPSISRPRLSLHCHIQLLSTPRDLFLPAPPLQLESIPTFVQLPSTCGTVITLEGRLLSPSQWTNFLCGALTKPRDHSLWCLLCARFVLWVWFFDACHPHGTFSHMRPGTVSSFPPLPLSLFFFPSHYIPTHIAQYLVNSKFSKILDEWMQEFRTTGGKWIRIT